MSPQIQSALCYLAERVDNLIIKMKIDILVVSNVNEVAGHDNHIWLKNPITNFCKVAFQCIKYNRLIIRRRF